MGWVKMRANLIDSAEVEMISMATTLDKFEVVGRLQYLWGWVFQYTKDGTTILDRATVDRKVCHPGFADAMVKVKWLADGEHGLVFVNWEKHNTTDAALKDKWASKKRVQRESPKCPPDVPVDKSEQTKTKTKSNTPPTPQGAKAGGGDCPSLEEIQKAWPSMTTPTAREVADLGLTADELNELDRAADEIKPPLRDKAAWLLVNARKYAERKRKRKPPPLHGGGSARPVEDRTDASAGRGASATTGGAA